MSKAQKHYHFDWTRQAKSGTEETPWLNNYEVHPTTPWNYALLIDEQHPEKSFRFVMGKMTELPFSDDPAPMQATVRGRHSGVPGTGRGIRYR